jgi:hypothetical protein
VPQFHDQELTLNNRPEIRKQRTLEDVYEIEKLEPESKERAMVISKLTAGLGLTEGF